MIDFKSHFGAGLTYDAFLAAHGSDEHRRRWAAVYEKIALTEAQRSLLKSFTRRMPVLCLAGAWCGDCVNQCPIFAHFAAACERIELRFFDRDTHPQLAGELKICGGARVPTVVFMSEDGYEVARYGDRTLSKYRDVVKSLSGVTCPTGVAPPVGDALATVTQEWLDQFERAQWILRSSARLREKHGD